MAVRFLDMPWTLYDTPLLHVHSGLPDHSFGVFSGFLGRPLPSPTPCLYPETPRRPNLPLLYESKPVHVPVTCTSMSDRISSE